MRWCTRRVNGDEVIGECIMVAVERYGDGLRYCNRSTGDRQRHGGGRRGGNGGRSTDRLVTSTASWTRSSNAKDRADGKDFVRRRQCVVRQDDDVFSQGCIVAQDGPTIDGRTGRGSTLLAPVCVVSIGDSE